eukprot:scaffold535037_cov39-Prasinocladus_malaysianus.AAC.1
MGHSDEEDDAMRGAPTAGVESPPRDHDSGEDEDAYSAVAMGMGVPARQTQSQRMPTQEVSGTPGDGEYNPADFANLNVGEDVKELFQYIGRYKPRPHQLETKL